MKDSKQEEPEKSEKPEEPDKPEEPNKPGEPEKLEESAPTLGNVAASFEWTRGKSQDLS